MSNVPDIVCLSTNEWTGLPTSKQHLMGVFARDGRVLYVEPPVDVFSTLGRRRRWEKLGGLRRVADRLWVLSPIVLGNRSDPGARLAFHERRVARVRGAVKRLGFASPVLWAFAPEHVPYAEAFPDSLIVYHAADEPRTFSPNPAATESQERALMARADLVFVASQALLDARRTTGKAHRLPNAADRRHFAGIIAGDPDASVETFMKALGAPRHVPTRLRGAGGPTVLFGGAAYGWFDDDLFLRLAAARPQWRFVLIGPVSGRLTGRGLPLNVDVVGRRPYGEFPWYVAGADVAILPIIEGETFRNCDPIVLYEYLLCGRPVVATRFPAALERGSLVRTADSPEEFGRAIEAALAERRTPEAMRPRVEFGFANTWERRAEEALHEIRSRLEARAARGRPERGHGGGPGGGRAFEDQREGKR